MTDQVTQPTPALLFDAVTFGWSFDVLPEDTDLIAVFRRNLTAQGVLRRGSDRQRIRLAVPVGDGGRLGHIQAELALTANTAGGRVRSNSSIDINLMRMLRRDLVLAPAQDSLDGNDNFVGATEGRTAELLVRQLDLVAQAFRALATCLNAALPAGSYPDDIKVWLRNAEACVDLSVEDAPRVCRWLRRSAFPGSIANRTDLYRASSDYRDGAHSVRYWRQKGGPAGKVYAKTPTLLRAEVVCIGSKAIKAVGCEHYSDDVAGADARALLLAFARGVADFHRDLHAHARAAADHSGSIADLLIALQPLIALAAGQARGRGRPPGPRECEAAGRALDTLFTDGSFDGTGHRQGTALRTVLEGLRGHSGPLARGGRRATYSIRPEFACAADTIAQRA